MQLIKYRFNCLLKVTKQNMSINADEIVGATTIKKSEFDGIKNEKANAEIPISQILKRAEYLLAIIRPIRGNAVMAENPKPTIKRNRGVALISVLEST